LSRIKAERMGYIICGTGTKWTSKLPCSKSGEKHEMVTTKHQATRPRVTAQAWAYETILAIEARCWASRRVSCGLLRIVRLCNVLLTAGGKAGPYIKESLGVSCPGWDKKPHCPAITNGPVKEDIPGDAEDSGSLLGWLCFPVSLLHYSLPYFWCILVLLLRAPPRLSYT
jgi:hypothetical protein